MGNLLLEKRVVFEARSESSCYLDAPLTILLGGIYRAWTRHALIVVGPHILNAVLMCCHVISLDRNFALIKKILKIAFLKIESSQDIIHRPHTKA